jgi:phosphopantothenoylcysteine decarboxylase
MAKVLLGVTGSVAAIKTPELLSELRARGHETKIVATAAALYFFDPGVLNPSRPGRDPDLLVLDSDEWPGQTSGGRYQRGDEVMHIALRRWADLLIIAPLDANTLAKLAGGLCDNCLTCVWRAWDPARPVLLAPAMNTFMWEHPLTARHLRQLAADASTELPDGVALDDLPAWINAHCRGLSVIPPVSKELACGDVGVGAMAAVDEIGRWVDRVAASLAEPQA